MLITAEYGSRPAPRQAPPSCFLCRVLPWAQSLCPLLVRRRRNGQNHCLSDVRIRHWTSVSIQLTRRLPPVRGYTYPHNSAPPRSCGASPGRATRTQTRRVRPCSTTDIRTKRRGKMFGAAHRGEDIRELQRKSIKPGVFLTSDTGRAHIQQQRTSSTDA